MSPILSPAAKGFAVLFLLAGASCAGSREQTVRDSLASRGERAAKRARAWSATKASRQRLEQGLLAYVAYAMERSPDLRASFERWRASVHRISRARRLPDPVVSFGYFIQSVETRVGPQLARVGLQQSFPWPTKLTAGADAASAQARALEEQFDALALMIADRVAQIYWRLWKIRRTRAIHARHLEVLRSLSASVLARVATGVATLADQQQVDLATARLEDMLQAMDEDERAAAAELRGVLGAPQTMGMPTPGEPKDAGVPVETLEELAKSVQRHPMIVSLASLAAAEDERARAEEADRYPKFTVGVDWIITGDAMDPTMPDSGKDAVVAGVGVSVPLWQGNYSDSVHAAHAEASAKRSEQRAVLDRALASLQASLSRVHDAARRVRLYRHTLVPQADSAYASVLGAYVVGKGTVAQTLMAQRDLLDLRVELERARASHAQSWARMEQVVGRSVRQRPFEYESRTAGQPAKDAAPP